MCAFCYGARTALWRMVRRGKYLHTESPRAIRHIMAERVTRLTESDKRYETSKLRQKHMARTSHYK